MKKQRLFAWLLLPFLLALPARADESQALPQRPALSGGFLPVYRDYASSQNTYRVKARMGTPGLEHLAQEMDENSPAGAYSGTSGIRCGIGFEAGSWGGWMFTHGFYPGGAKAPELNFGDHPDSGFDLTGAEALTFYARGENGGEKVEFFMGGLGWNPETMVGTADYPDSTPKITLGTVALSDTWQVYEIPLAGADLSYISCAFGFSASGANNTGDITFYLDEIAFRFPAGTDPAGKANPAAEEPLPAESGDTDEPAMPETPEPAPEPAGADEGPAIPAVAALPSDPEAPQKGGVSGEAIAVTVITGITSVAVAAIGAYGLIRSSGKKKAAEAAESKTQNPADE